MIFCTFGLTLGRIYHW